MSFEKNFDEKKALQLLAQGSEFAFIQIFDKYQGKIFNTALKMLNSREQAKEAVQEIFLDVWHRREQMAEVLNFNAFMNSAVRNYVYNVFRDKPKWIRASREFSWRPNFDNSTEWKIQEDEYQKLLTDALSTLSEQQQEIFRLSREEGLSHEQIGTRLNLTTLSVKAHMKRVLKALREKLEPYIGSASILIIVTLFSH